MRSEKIIFALFIGFFIGAVLTIFVFDMIKDDKPDINKEYIIVYLNQDHNIKEVEKKMRNEYDKGILPYFIGDKNGKK